MPDSLSGIMPEVNRVTVKLEELKEDQLIEKAKLRYKTDAQQKLFVAVVKYYRESGIRITGSSRTWYKDWEFDMDILSQLDQPEVYLDWFNRKPISVIRVVEDALSFLRKPIESLTDEENKYMPKTVFWLKIKSGKQPIPVRDLDSTQLDQLVVLEGTVRAKTELMGKMKYSKWKCYGCNTTGVLGIYATTNKMYCAKCDRGYKLERRRDSSLYYFKLDDPDASAVGGITRSINIEVLFGLAESQNYNKLTIGSKVKVTGILERKEKKKDGEYFFKVSTRNIEFIEAKKEIVVTEEDKAEFHKIIESPTLVEDLAKSVAPNIRGYELAKKACFLQLIGGNELVLNGQLEERGTIHILLISSPGLGKSQLIKRVITFLRGCRFSAGKTLSGVGLVAAMMKDEDIGGWYVSAGAVALASGAVCAVDELDKVSKEDLGYLNSAMVDMKVPIDKAGLHVVLDTKTSILAAANPKNRVFDKGEPVWKQLGLPKDFLDRFDMIVPMESPRTDEEKTAVANVVVGKYEKDSVIVKPIYPFEFMVKYIQYAKSFYPELAPDVREYIVKNYINIARPSDKEDREDQAYFSFRLITNIVRLAQAYAKARLSTTVEVTDAQSAINLMIESLKSQQIITADNLMDYERGEAIVPKKKRSAQAMIKEVIKDLQDGNVTDHLADFTDIVKECAKLNLMPDVVEQTLESLSRMGEIMEPKRNRYQVL